MLTLLCALQELNQCKCLIFTLDAYWVGLTFFPVCLLVEIVTSTLCFHSLLGTLISELTLPAKPQVALSFRCCKSRA